MIILQRITVYGRVQGVGFRPAACRLAAKYELQGYVRNLGGVVEIIVRGEEEKLDLFLTELSRLPQPVAIERIIRTDLSDYDYAYFCKQYNEGQDNLFAAIASTEGSQAGLAAADIAVCSSCLAELNNNENRRYGYSYIACAACGPRYTIMHKYPYDRENTSMKAMALCPACAKEYRDIADRRSHGETISCHSCGPQLKGYIRSRENKEYGPAEAIAGARELLLQGKIIVVKAVGGYNLVCRADMEETVARLRCLKHRPTKPFAIMCSLAIAAAFIDLHSPEGRELLSYQRPIVLIENNMREVLASNVAACCHELGVMLPSTGFYSQLCELELPLVVTSCNYSGQPIIYNDEEAWQFYEQCQELWGFFTYNRDILRPVDDSLLRVLDKDNKQILRRGRGYVPEYIINEGCKHAVLAAGADMEPGFCLGGAGRFYPGQLPGDLLEEKTEEEWRRLTTDWQRLFGVTPEAIVSDLHPAYISTGMAEAMAADKNIRHYQLQHHHAHALSVMAEHRLQGRTLAVVFDGTGYGTDETVWGGEFLLCEGLDYKRLAHLAAYKLIGGDESMKQAWKTGLCYLYSLLQDNKCHSVFDAHALKSFDERIDIIEKALANDFHVIRTSSAGRLFDAAAYILGLGEYNSHQGYCAQLLEKQAALALKYKEEPLCMQLYYDEGSEEQSRLAVDKLILKLWETRLAFSEKKVRAAALGFHYAIADYIKKMVMHSAGQGFNQVVLAGGCFANKILLTRTTEVLEAAGFKVYYNQQVPPGDGGIALGQAYYGSLKLAEELASEGE